jgi:putative salt-induced outer membrane protein
VALGVGHKFVDEPNALFSVFGGAGYTTDRYREPQTIDDRTGTRFSRTSLLLGEETSHNLTASTSFKQRLEVYPGLSGDEAKIVKFNANLAVAISQTLNLTVGFNGVYNSNPPDGQRKSDAALFTGINVKFGAL